MSCRWISRARTEIWISQIDTPSEPISSSNAADTAVVLDQTAAEPLSLADRFGDFLTSIVEYFR